MVEREGVVKLLTPEPPVRTVPPDATENQSVTLPVSGTALKRREPAPHLEEPVATGRAGTGRTVTKTGVRVAETQPLLVFLASAKYVVVVFSDGVV